MAGGHILYGRSYASKGLRLSGRLSQVLGYCPPQLRVVQIPLDAEDDGTIRMGASEADGGQQGAFRRDYLNLNPPDVSVALRAHAEISRPDLVFFDHGSIHLLR